MLNYSKPSNVLVFDLINLANPGLPASINADNCTVEKIVEMTPGPASNFRNTSARIRGVQGSGFRDSITVYYDRVKLPTLLPFGNSAIRDAAAFTTFTAANVHAALSAINETYGLNFGTMDVVNAAIGGAGVANNMTTIALTATVNSPAYTGSASITCKRGLPVLDTSVVVDVLDTLKHPIEPSLQKKSISLLTYGIDFTAYKNLLAVDASGLPQWAGLRALLDELGIPAYDGPLNSNTVQDVPTSTAQYANKAFDRVVIQTGIDNGQVKGQAYYHYNS